MFILYLIKAYCYFNSSETERLVLEDWEIVFVTLYNIAILTICYIILDRMSKDDSKSEIYIIGFIYIFNLISLPLTFVLYQKQINEENSNTFDLFSQYSKFDKITLPA